MAKPSEKDVVRALLAEYGRTYCEEIGIKVERNTPAELFKWLVASILLSARIRSNIAVEAARALFAKGWTSPQKMANSTWAERTKTLNRTGYARYDERTSRMLGETGDLLVERYGGDLRKLRDEAEREPRKERALLKGFKGMGDVGVDIFFREVQAAWPEVGPFVDDRARRAARKLGLSSEPERLAKLVPESELPTLVAALTRVQLEDGLDAVRERANARAA